MSSINSEIEIIKTAKDNLASTLVTDFGVLALDEVDASGNVISEGLATSDGTLKRLSAWNPILLNTIKYLPLTGGKLTGELGVNADVATAYSITTGKPIRVSYSGKQIMLDVDNKNNTYLQSSADNLWISGGDVNGNTVLSNVYYKVNNVCPGSKDSANNLGTTSYPWKTLNTVEATIGRAASGYNLNSILKGLLKFQNSNASYTSLQPSSTSNITLNLPSSSGTLALTSQIPNTVSNAYNAYINEATIDGYYPLTMVESASGLSKFESLYTKGSIKYNPVLDILETGRVRAHTYTYSEHPENASLVVYNSLDSGNQDSIYTSMRPRIGFVYYDNHVDDRYCGQIVMDKAGFTFYKGSSDTSKNSDGSWKGTTDSVYKASNGGSPYAALVAGEIKTYYENALKNVLHEGNTFIDGNTITINNISKTIPAYTSKTAVSGGTTESLVTTGEKYTWNNKLNAINASNKLEATNISGLATVATTGSYNDLSNKPTIPTSLPANGGTADKAKVLNNYYSSRPITANATFTEVGGLKTFVATSSMTEGKPPQGDSHILHMSWAPTNLWDTQLAASADGNGELQIRGKKNGTWGNWNTVLTSNNYTNYTSSYLPLSGGTMTGTINSQDILPKTTGTYNLGNNTYRYNAIYGNYFNAAGDDNNTIYGKNYIHSTASWFSLLGPGSTTANEASYTELVLGNGNAQSSTSNHSEGVLTLYSAGTLRHILRGETTNTAYSHYLRNVSGYLVQTSGTSAVGSSTQPVYINANGEAVACNTFVSTSEQTLTDAQKTQVKTNLGIESTLPNYELTFSSINSFIHRSTDALNFTVSCTLSGIECKTVDIIDNDRFKVFKLLGKNWNSTNGVKTITFYILAKASYASELSPQWCFYPTALGNYSWIQVIDNKGLFINLYSGHYYFWNDPSVASATLIISIILRHIKLPIRFEASESFDWGNYPGAIITHSNPISNFNIISTTTDSSYGLEEIHKFTVDSSGCTSAVATGLATVGDFDNLEAGESYILTIKANTAVIHKVNVR